jgi:hypothetical protein
MVSKLHETTADVMSLRQKKWDAIDLRATRAWLMRSRSRYLVDRKRDHKCSRQIREMEPSLFVRRNRNVLQDNIAADFRASNLLSARFMMVKNLVHAALERIFIIQ